MPPGGHTIFLSKNNIKNEFSNIKLLTIQIFIKICQILKTIGGFFTFFLEKMPRRGELDSLHSSDFFKNPFGAFLDFVQKIIKI